MKIGVRNKRVISKPFHFARHWFSSMVDLRRAVSILKLPRYFVGWRTYNRLAGKNSLRWNESYPCLTDWVGTTPFDAHYFYQAHWAADKLARRMPSFHVDIGSSTLFVGTTSAFVPLIFVDYRPLQISLPGFQPLSGDLISLPFADSSIPSLSCLHVIEHVGLGRYGDRIDPAGSFKSATEIVRVLRPGGQLLLSTPVGRERIQFNAHRIFAPTTVVSMLSALRLIDFSLVDDRGVFHSQATLSQAAQCEYGCGMFEFMSPVD